MGEAPRRIVPSGPADFESEAVALAADEETIVLSAVGEWSAADLWLRATDETWGAAVRVLLYGQVGSTRVLLQSRVVDEGATTADDGELFAFVMSHRGPRVTAFEVALWTAESSLAGTGTITLRAWSNQLELPYMPASQYPSDVTAHPDTVVRRDGAGRARVAGLDLHGASISWDAEQPSATLGWSAPDPSGVGGGMTVRAQQGASGSVGGALTLGGGDGGTSSENTGDTVVELGPQVGIRTAGLSVVSNGTQIGRLSGFAGTLSFRAGTGLGASGNVGRIGLGLETHSFTVSASLGQCILSSEQADVVLACGPTSGNVVLQGGYLATACTITPRATGATSVTWAQGIASLTDSIAQRTTGAGVTRSIAGQRGAAGSVGGNVVVAAGEGGTPGTNLPGNVVVDLRTPVSNVSGRQQWALAGGDVVASLYQFQSGWVGLRAGSGDVGSGPTGAKGLAIDAELITLLASSGELKLVAQGSHVDLSCAAGETIRHQEGTSTVLTESLDADGATSLTWAAGLTSLTDSIEQRESGAGATRSIEGQRGAAASVGGNVVVAAGEGGTPGTNLPGNVVVDLRTPVSNVSGRQQWSAGGSVVAQLYQSDVDTTALRIGSGNVGDGATGAKAFAVEASAVTLLAASGPLVLFPAAGDLHLSHAAGEHILHKEGGSTVLREQLDADGASSLELASGTTSWAVGQESRASGVGATHVYTAQATTASGQAGGGLSLRGGSGDPGGPIELIGGSGNVTNDGDGGHAHIAGGAGGGSGAAGNVTLCAASAPGSWASLSRGLFVGNAAAEPTGAPSGGQFLYGRADGSLQAVNASNLQYGIVPRGGPSAFGAFTYDPEVAVETTPDATAKTITSRTMVTGAVYQVDVYAIGWNTSGNQVGSYRKAATFKRSSGGTSAQVGSTELLCREQEDAGGLDVTIVLSTHDILVRAVGLAATSITWVAEVQWRIFKP